MSGTFALVSVHTSSPDSEGNVERKTIKKRGRPRTNGRKPGWVLGRALIAIEAYDRARRDGHKHWVALGVAVDAVRRELPGVAISTTEVKRALAALRPRVAAEALLVIKTDRAWVFGFGPRPDYRRRAMRGSPPDSVPSFRPVGRVFFGLKNHLN